MLTISMFSLYTFGEWQPWNSSSPLAIDFSWLYANGYFPLLPHFLWEYFAGLWIWALPFLVIGAWLLLACRHQSVLPGSLPPDESRSFAATASRSGRTKGKHPLSMFATTPALL